MIKKRVLLIAVLSIFVLANFLIAQRYCSERTDTDSYSQSKITDLNDRLATYRQDILVGERITSKKMDAFFIKLERELKTFGQLTEVNLRKANLTDYLKWLAVYLGNGGKPTHYYNYNMHFENWFVAFKPTEISPLYGSSSVCIILPSRDYYLGGELGHNELYFLDDGTHIGYWVPIYNDIKF